MDLLKAKVISNRILKKQSTPSIPQWLFLLVIFIKFLKKGLERSKVTCFKLSLTLTISNHIFGLASGLYVFMGEWTLVLVETRKFGKRWKKIGFPIPRWCLQENGNFQLHKRHLRNSSGRKWIANACHSQILPRPFPFPRKV